MPNIADALPLAQVDPVAVLSRLGLAALLGFVIGLDRELKQRTLGLRTTMLVAIGSSLFGIIALEIFDLVEAMGDQARIDPTRVVEGVIGGIGFLGAGAIIQGRGSITGGTTAATIWTVGGVGLACGFGLYALAVLACFVVFVVVTILGFFTGSRKDDEPKRKDA
jgi:putative Mg2+ transporter-C (MgtC) family protein